MRTLKFLFSGVTIIAAFTSQAAVISVPGTSDIWLAGMPDGTAASSGDSAPTHSPVFVNGVDLSVESITFNNVTGGVRHNPGCPPGCFDPDGGTFFNHAPGAINGLSDLRAPINSLVGVFLDDNQPDSSAAPGALDFEVSGTDFVSLDPELKQVFFIGDGLTGTGGGEAQSFTIPEGATRFYLGTMDGFGWFNNSGSLEVDILMALDDSSGGDEPIVDSGSDPVADPEPATPNAVPIPGAVWLFGTGIFGLLGLRKKYRFSAAQN